MDTIVFTHFGTPVQGASGPDLALARFGAWSDAEIVFLEDLFDMADLKGLLDGYEDAIDDVVALNLLSRPSGASQEDIRRLLAEALPALERLLEFMRTIPLDVACVGGGRSNFNAWVHRSEMRLEDLLEKLRPALAA